jgi:tetratricopeptide (TPR) repeat protein
MTEFIQQLRKRGVFRVAGLYVAVIWLLLQIADVVFPAFEIPDSAVRYILLIGVGGFPIALIFAWFFEITDQGIQREDELKETGARRLQTRRYVYGATVVALLLALLISVFFNVQQVIDEPGVTPENVSILIADMVNQTGNPVFNGALEQSLAIGLEGASFITSFQRQQAVGIADKISEGDGLDEDRARLVAMREGVKLVLSGAISAEDDGFLLRVKTKNPKEGSIVASAEANADTQLEVLQAVGELATQIREALGDVILETKELNANETFSTASLQAVNYYSQAQSLSQLGWDKEAVVFYKQATEEDPNFGRAYSGWALSEHNLGNIEASQSLWDKTLTLLGSMTERERYRTLGLYYTLASRNYDKAIENYELLVGKFPADAIGRNNLAVTYFFNMQFDKALEQGRSVLEIYPSNPLFRSNYALYAMYAGDFTTARIQAEKLLQQDNDYYKAYLPLAMSKLAAGDTDAAIRAYSTMVSIDSRAQSLSSIGLADVALYQGNYEQAIEALVKGIDADVESGNKRGQADKFIALAQAQLAREKPEEARQAIDRALELSQALAHIVPAAQLYVNMGEFEKATALQLQLQEKLQPEFRAAAGLIEANILLAKGETITAIDTLLASRKKLDSWLIHMALGQAYYAAGHYVEALSEFELCKSRIGEATAIFLDDIPSFRYAAPLSEWMDRTRDQLGMKVQ